MRWWARLDFQRFVDYVVMLPMRWRLDFHSHYDGEICLFFDLLRIAEGSDGYWQSYGYLKFLDLCLSGHFAQSLTSRIPQNNQDKSLILLRQFHLMENQRFSLLLQPDVVRMLEWKSKPRTAHNSMVLPSLFGSQKHMGSLTRRIMHAGRQLISSSLHWLE
jgi:hypothetical protein